MHRLRMHVVTEFAKFAESREAKEVFRFFQKEQSYRPYHHRGNRSMGDEDVGRFAYQAVFKDANLQENVKVVFDIRDSIPAGWGLLENGTLYQKLDSKIDLVKELQDVGVSAEDLKKLQTMKVKELKEILDRTKPTEDAEVSEIVNRLLKSGDLVTYTTSLGELKVEVGEGGAHGGVHYEVSIDWIQKLGELLAALEKEMKNKGLTVYRGQFDANEND